MSSISSNIAHIRESLPAGVELVCVSKYHTAEQIMEAYDAGERHFAESRAKDFVGKYELLPKDIHWHFIGHLQTNKVRDVLPRAALIQSVDSERLLQKISDEAEKIGKIQDVLLEVHVAREQTKTGFSVEAARTLLQDMRTYNSTGIFAAFPSVRICGLMCMASNTDDDEQIACEFAEVNRLARECFDNPIVSMGMSDDYHIAIANGSNMVRVGSLIVGERS